MANKLVGIDMEKPFYVERTYIHNYKIIKMGSGYLHKDNLLISSTVSASICR